MRMHRMSPKMPAPVTPIASATTTQFSGMASIAPRVEIGFDQLSGVARSSRTGTKRNVKAGPTTRLPGKAERHRARHPGTANAFLQQHRGDGAGRDLRSASSAAVMMSSLSSRRQAKPLVAPAQIGDERDRQAEPSRPCRRSGRAGSRASRRRATETPSSRARARPCSRR